MTEFFYKGTMHLGVRVGGVAGKSAKLITMDGHEVGAANDQITSVW